MDDRVVLRFCTRLSNGSHVRDKNDIEFDALFGFHGEATSCFGIPRCAHQEACLLRAGGATTSGRAQLGVSTADLHSSPPGWLTQDDVHFFSSRSDADARSDAARVNALPCGGQQRRHGRPTGAARRAPRRP
ncbi:hypothetical protein FJT64_004594 [Amphibalanus amphitrite]|uniref:Uncharacterized protein n=1 Tax=Amphibalanus amphitrite TaxID=1232801 RepID=A0A6A4VV71_AMPAM|nr:hypothetical protein FJT64_004594 [Amphibalanus amphitrite]